MSLAPHVSIGERINSLWGVKKYEASEQDYKTRWTELVKEAQAHQDEVVLIDHLNTHSTYGFRHSYKMGIVLDKVEDVDPKDWWSGVKITASYVEEDLREWQMPIGIGIDEYTDSFNTRTQIIDNGEDMHLEDIPCFRAVYGMENIAKWLSSNDYDEPRGLPLETYVRMAKILGVEPFITPEVEEAKEKRRSLLIVKITKLALEQTRLTNRIDAIYSRIGKDLVTFSEGALELGPESKGEANIMTLRQREKLSDIQRNIEEIKAELLDLGINKDEYYTNIAELLGLDLSGRGETTQE